jgi:hypothetical protein
LHLRTYLRAREKRTVSAAAPPLPDRLRAAKLLREGRRQAHPAARWLDAARRYSAPELQGETLVASRLSEEDAAALEALVRHKRQIVTEEGAAALTNEETAAWERLLGKAAGDEALFGRKRRDAAARAGLDNLGDARKIASLPRQPLLAEPGSVQLPRFAVFSWLVGRDAHDGAWTLMDLGLLAALLGAFENRDPRLIVGARFEREGAERALVVPGGVGADLRMHGRIAGSSLEDGSGHVRVKSALAVLQRNKWVEVEQTVGELRIRLAELARKLNGPPGN